MNKDDIKKALEVCTDCYSTCDDCPYDDVGNCGDTLKTDACELIVEQENEIERLKDDYAKLQEQFAQYQMASDADKLKADIDRLNTIVERLDELLGKGINDYIMGIDGVEGIKDMWERSAVREFADKVKAKSYVNDYCREVVEIDKIDELLKEYE